MSPHDGHDTPQPPKSPAHHSYHENDVTFMIKNANPIGQDTAVYEFSKYQLPAVEEYQSARSWVKRLDSRFTTRIAQLSILLARSSGRDKVASVVQYGAMFWGSQPFVNITGIENNKDAPWVKLEESMSSGRKLFRLLKWIKEYERARFALTCPESYLCVLGTRTRTIVIRILAVLMNSFSFMYYLTDNLVWAAQSNLINRTPGYDAMKKALLKTPKIPLEKYIELHGKHTHAVDQRKAAIERVEGWKDWKNRWSLWRLILALVHDTIQIRALRIENHRLHQVYARRIRYAKGEHVDDFSNFEKVIAECKSVEELEEEFETRVKDVQDAISDFVDDVVMGLANLGILLNRLRVKPFQKLPTWVIGILGVIAGYIGCLKNFPSYVPAEKQHKVFKMRSTSIDAELQNAGNLRETDRLGKKLM